MLRITKTENGMVRGFPGTDARITVFKGIPFAADTSGENRWKAPQPAKDWEGIRDCYEYGPITMQTIPGEDPDAFYSKEWHVDPEVPMSEDSLSLNIWTPAKAADEKLPVMVWIFGGGHKVGYSYEMEFDGERIASRGVILVSVAYRVNVFGFLCHPEITAENPDAPGNFGLLDQLAGIKWVKRNIANFGGDPDNITIFGQSAGGSSVYSQLCSPIAKGTFQKAIIESTSACSFTYPLGAARPPKMSLKEAEALGVEFFKNHLGVETLEEARKLDAKFVLDKFLASNLNMGVMIDGVHQVEDTVDSLKNNTINNLPIIIGNTTDEFIVGPKEATEECVVSWIKENFGEYADKYEEICRKIAGDDMVKFQKAAGVCRTEASCNLAIDYLTKFGHDVYYYNFGPTIPGDDAGAFHSSDLWFEFETLMKCWRPFDGHHYDLSRKMCNYWTNFAKYGNPNGNDADGTPMVEWTKCTPDNRAHINFFDEISMSESELTEKNGFLVEINK